MVEITIGTKETLWHTLTKAKGAIHPKVHVPGGDVCGVDVFRPDGEPNVGAHRAALWEDVEADGEESQQPTHRPHVVAVYVPSHLRAQGRVQELNMHQGTMWNHVLAALQFEYH